MKVGIVGAGAVGGHLAARLAKAGETVSVLARGAHLAAMQRDGLQFENVAGDFTVRVNASDDPHALGVQDVVFVTVKANTLATVAPLVPPLLGPETPVVFAQNGIPWWYFHRFDNRPWRRLARLAPDGALERAVGLDRVIGCVIYSPNELVAPGVVRNTLPRNRFIIGEPDGSRSQRIERLAAMFSAAGVEAPVDLDIRRHVWSKLFSNMANSATTCLTGGTIGQMLTDPEVVAMSRQMNVEASAIARSHGLDVQPLFTPELVSATLNSPVAGHKPSMLQDLEAAKPMEVDAQFLVPRDFAREADIATPVLDAVSALVKARARLAGCYDG
jgi:2-dehydropantoate 2-reductase